MRILRRQGREIDLREPAPAMTVARSSSPLSVVAPTALGEWSVRCACGGTASSSSEREAWDWESSHRCPLA